MKNKIRKILKNWLIFMDLEKSNKLRIDKKNGKALKNEQFVNYSQINDANKFLSIGLTNKQYDTFKELSKYFYFLTLSAEEKEKFLKKDEIDDNIYFSALLVGSNSNDFVNNKNARYIYPILSIPLKNFKLNGTNLKIDSINDIATFNVFKNFLVNELLIDESDIVDGENIIEFLSNVTNTNLRTKSFLEDISFVSDWI
jgi:hypothetical protein